MLPQSNATNGRSTQQRFEPASGIWGGLLIGIILSGCATTASSTSTRATPAVQLEVVMVTECEGGVDMVVEVGGQTCT